MKKSLKNILLNHLRIKGTLTNQEIEEICHTNKYKTSNAERALRSLRDQESKSYNPLIRVKFKKNYIDYYYYDAPINNELDEWRTNKLIKTTQDTLNI